MLARALQFHRSGNLLEAERVYREILASEPSSAEAWYYLGSIQQVKGKLDAGVDALRRALSLRPDYPEALHNLGVLLAQRKQFDEGAACLERAARLRPDWTESHRNLGAVCAEQGKLDEAAQCYRRMTDLSPRDPEAYNLLGSVLAREGEIAQAVDCFEEAVRLEPRYQTAHSNLLLALNYVAELEPLWLFAEHCFWGRLHGQGPSLRPAQVRDASPDRRLRVGYVSPDFRAHAVAPFVEPILAHHDPRNVEVVAYAEVNAPDATSDRMKSLVRHWRSTVGLSDEQVADQIRADSIDILVDLAGHSARNRLGAFTRQPAPVQATYLGYPNTSGLTTVGFRITDAAADPADEPKRHTEELLRLEGPFCCWRPPEDAPATAPPASRNGYVTFGSLHNLAKLNDRVLDLWAQVLQAVPRARLLVFRNTLQGRTADRLREKLLRRGVDERRIELRHQPDAEGGYLGVYREVDVLLDAFPWSGHATTCESLWMGVPVITLRGNRHAGRMSASILSCLGLHDWVASSTSDYVQAAVRAATRPETRASLRTGLRDRMRASALCDGEGFARRLEAAYRLVWRRFVAAGE